MNHQIVKAGPGFHVGDAVLAWTVDKNRVVEKQPKVVQGHKLEKIRIAGKDAVVGDGLDSCACDRLEIDWLPFAAQQYQISPNIKDYVLVEVYSVCASIPNRNLDSFPYNELVSWRTMAGRPAYKTFVGKPVHQDHDNQDDTKAKGVIFDATMVPFRGKWHVKILKGFDRTKDSKLASMVQQKNRVGHSMGALVERAECGLPWCRYMSDGITTCEHIQGGAGKGQIIRGFLVEELMRDFSFVEDSSVADEANVIAITDYIWGV